jgi:hypothetical protein
MLFRLVCGPDLEEVWTFAERHGPQVPRGVVNHWLVQQQSGTESTTNIDEALTVLRTLRLVTGTDTLSAAPIYEPFRLAVLRKMREFALAHAPGDHVLDSWYLRVLDVLFITPDVIFLADLHRQANRLNPPAPLNDEKLNAWRRVLEWLGIGRRVGNGFVALYAPELMTCMLQTWGRTEGPLEEFLRHVDQFLPCVADHTDLPQALLRPLAWLERAGHLELTHKQDAPYKAFSGQKRLNWVRVEGWAT